MGVCTLCLNYPAALQTAENAAGQIILFYSHANEPRPWRKHRLLLPCPPSLPQKLALHRFVDSLHGLHTGLSGRYPATRYGKHRSLWLDALVRLASGCASELGEAPYSFINALNPLSDVYSFALCQGATMSFHCDFLSSPVTLKTPQNAATVNTCWESVPGATRLWPRGLWDDSGTCQLPPFPDDFPWSRARRDPS